LLFNHAKLIFYFDYYGECRALDDSSVAAHRS
jgi:hypothetical protein